MTASFLISYLESAGWKQVRKQGMHCILSHPNHPNLVAIPDLGEQALKPGLINDICREAGLKGRISKLQFTPSGVMNMIRNILGRSR